MQKKTEQNGFFPTLRVIAQSLLETTAYPLPLPRFHSFRGNRFFAPLEASGELLILYLFNYKYSLVSKTVFRLFLRRLVPEIFNWVQIFRSRYQANIRRPRDKDFHIHGKELS